MEPRMVLNEILDRTQDSNSSVPEAPHSIGRIAEYRGKVYLALLHIEKERVSVAPSMRISAACRPERTGYGTANGIPGIRR
jgi:hypothetical protein